MGENTFLTEVIEVRRRRIEEARTSVPHEVIRKAAEKRAERRDFAAALSVRGLSVIAELKQASPSRGVIRPDYRPCEIALAYESSGARALSVLTEERFFRGSLNDLTQARDAVQLPVLRKDFIVDDYQVYESVAAGADALLLIVAALPDPDLQRLLGLCRQLRIAALVEVHTEPDLHRALDAGTSIIGVNNRNLETLEVSLETSFRLREKIPAGCLAVSESGIKTPDQMRRLAGAGFDAVLIGEHLLLAGDPGKELSLLLEGVRPVKVD